MASEDAAVDSRASCDCAEESPAAAVVQPERECDNLEVHVDFTKFTDDPLQNQVDIAIDVDAAHRAVSNALAGIDLLLRSVDGTSRPATSGPCSFAPGPGTPPQAGCSASRVPSRQSSHKQLKRSTSGGLTTRLSGGSAGQLHMQPPPPAAPSLGNLNLHVRRASAAGRLGVCIPEYPRNLAPATAPGCLMMQPPPPPGGPGIRSAGLGIGQQFRYVNYPHQIPPPPPPPPPRPPSWPGPGSGSGSMHGGEEQLPALRSATLQVPQLQQLPVQLHAVPQLQQLPGQRKVTLVRTGGMRLNTPVQIQLTPHHHLPAQALHHLPAQTQEPLELLQLPRTYFTTVSQHPPTLAANVMRTAAAPGQPLLVQQLPVHLRQAPPPPPPNPGYVNVSLPGLLPADQELSLLLDAAAAAGMPLDAAGMPQVAGGAGTAGNPDSPNGVGRMLSMYGTLSWSAAVQAKQTNDKRLLKQLQDEHILVIATLNVLTRSLRGQLADCDACVDLHYITLSAHQVQAQAPGVSPSFQTAVQLLAQIMGLMYRPADRADVYHACVQLLDALCWSSGEQQQLVGQALLQQQERGGGTAAGAELAAQVAQEMVQLAARSNGLLDDVDAAAAAVEAVAAAAAGPGSSGSSGKSDVAGGSGGLVQLQLPGMPGGMVGGGPLSGGSGKDMPIGPPGTGQQGVPLLPRSLSAPSQPPGRGVPVWCRALSCVTSQGRSGTIFEEQEDEGTQMGQIGEETQSLLNSLLLSERADMAGLMSPGMMSPQMGPSMMASAVSRAAAGKQQQQQLLLPQDLELMQIMQ